MGGKQVSRLVRPGMATTINREEGGVQSLTHYVYNPLGTSPALTSHNYSAPYLSAAVSQLAAKALGVSLTRLPAALMHVGLPYVT